MLIKITRVFKWFNIIFFVTTRAIRACKIRRGLKGQT